MDLNGKSCIVTGAADGVGLAVAQKLAISGAKVVLADRSEEAVAKQCKELTEEGHQAVYFSGDIHARLTIANLISTTIDAFDRIDVLVNASRDIVQADPLDMAAEDLTEAFEANVTATFRLVQMVVKRMQKQAADADRDEEAGAIVNVTSITSSRALPQMMAYAVAGAGLDQMTRSLAVRLAPERIRVNSVAIGSIMSSNLRTLINDDPELRERILAVTPVGRIGDSADAAEAVAFLASEAARFVTGQVFSVDGGRSLADPLGFAAI